MKPILRTEGEGIWKVHFVDNVMVAPDTEEIKGKTLLNGGRLWGSQAKGRYVPTRPLLKIDPEKKYYYREVVIISTNIFRLVSEHEDLSDWFLVTNPINPALVRAG